MPSSTRVASRVDLGLQLQHAPRAIARSSAGLQLTLHAIVRPAYGQPASVGLGRLAGMFLMAWPAYDAIVRPVGGGHVLANGLAGSASSTWRPASAHAAVAN